MADVAAHNRIMRVDRQCASSLLAIMNAAFEIAAGEAYGAISHGHALGISETRLVTTVIHEMKRRKVRYGLVTLCIGGGQGLAMILENVQKVRAQKM